MRLPRKLKKKYKKMGIWKSYCDALTMLDNAEFVALKKKWFSDFVTYGIVWIKESSLQTFVTI